MTPSSLKSSRAFRNCLVLVGSRRTTQRRLGGKIRQACEPHVIAFGQGVADAQGAMVRNTDDVTGLGAIGDFTVLEQKQYR